MKAFFKYVIVWVLQYEARAVLRKYKPRIVGVTGSVGKTTTKDAIFTALSKSRYVRKSEKSYNSEVGIPLTVLGIENAWLNPFKWLKNILEGFLLVVTKNHYPRWLVLEVGADRPGDIKKVSRWIKPDVAVITRLPDLPVHIEFFNSVEDIIEEKWALADALKPDGALILNYDDERVRALKKRAKNLVFTFGFDEDADLHAANAELFYENEKVAGVRFRVDYGGSSVPITVYNALGKQHIYPVLAALAVGVSQDIDMVSLGEAFADYVPSPGRMHLIEGKSGTVIIDDSYNSSPAALEEALNALAEIETPGRKIAVLGDMLELGEHSAKAHRDAGAHVAKVADMLVTAGVRARHIADEARQKRMAKSKIEEFTDSTDAGEFLEKEVKAGDTLLIKGSQSMRMERTVKMLMAHPEKARHLLPRQDPEWQAR